MRARRRSISALCAVALLVAPVASQQRKDRTSTEEYEAIVEEYAAAYEAYLEALKKAPQKSGELYRKKRPKPEDYAARMLKFAKRNPSEPTAVDALMWIVKHVSGVPELEQAVSLLLEQHIASEKLDQCFDLYRHFGSGDPLQERLAQALLDKSPHRHVKRVACLQLAQLLGRRAGSAQQGATRAQLRSESEKYFRQAMDEFGDLDTLLFVVDRSRGPTRLAALDRLIEKHASEERVVLQVNTVAIAENRDLSNESLLDRVLEKSSDSDRALRGAALYGLARHAKRKGDVASLLTYSTPQRVGFYERVYGPDWVAALRDKAPESFYARAERLFGQVVDEFSDLEGDTVAFRPNSENVYVEQVVQRRPLGRLAEPELYELRHLTAGRPAPEIEGQDLGGETFRLSDYRGKAVLLFFFQHSSQYCREVYPDLRSIVDRLPERRFALIGVSSDDRDELTKLGQQGEITWRVVWDDVASLPSESIAGQWNIRDCPVIYLLDGKGVIRHKFLGPVRAQSLEALIEQLL